MKAIYFSVIEPLVREVAKLAIFHKEKCLMQRFVQSESFPLVKKLLLKVLLLHTCADLPVILSYA